MKLKIIMPKFPAIQLIDPHDYVTTRWVGTIDDPTEVVDCSCGATIPVWDYMPEFGRCFKCMGKCDDCVEWLLPVELLDAYYSADNEFRFYLCKTHNA